MKKRFLAALLASALLLGICAPALAAEQSFPPDITNLFLTDYPAAGIWYVAAGSRALLAACLALDRALAFPNSPVPDMNSAAAVAYNDDELLFIFCDAQGVLYAITYTPTARTASVSSAALSDLSLSVPLSKARLGGIIEDVLGLSTYEFVEASAYSDAIGQLRDAIAGTQEPENGDVSAPVASGAPLLPEPHAFFHSLYRHGEQPAGSDVYTIDYDFDHNGTIAACEYADLLLDPRFSLVQQQAPVVLAKYANDTVTYYLYDYTGGGDVGQISVIIDGAVYSASVIVKIDASPTFNWCMLDIMADGAFTFTDLGDRCTVIGFNDKKSDGVLAPVGGGDGSGSAAPQSTRSSGSGTSSSNHSVSTIPPRCLKCHGDKVVECSNCDGKGYKVKYISVPNYSGSYAPTTTAQKENCFKCRGTGYVECPACGGTGYKN